MAEALDRILAFFASRLSLQSLTALALCASAIYIWYQHLRHKLLMERLEHEAHKRRTFIEEVRALASTQPEPPATSAGAAEHLLVVDDERAVLRILQRMLLAHDTAIRVDTASDGWEALQKIRDDKPALLITDIAMPNLDGIGLLATLQAEGLDVPTLVLSGYASEEIFPQLLKTAGLQPRPDLLFLQKPIRLEELVQTLAELRGARAKNTATDQGKTDK